LIWLWAALVGGLVFCAVGASGASAAGSPLFTPVPGSPFSADLGASSVAFSPSGGLLAFADQDGTRVATVAASGALSPVSVSSSPTRLGFPKTAFSPDGQLLATTDLDAGTVSVDSVSEAGMLTPVPGSPFAVGAGPSSMVFSPNGSLLAVLTGSTGAEQVSMFSVSSAGALSPVPGSPFPAGTEPLSIAFSPNGSFLAVTESGSAQTPGSVSVFSVASTGALSAAPVSSAGTGVEPNAVAFAPDGGVLAVTNVISNSVSMFSLSASGALAAVPGSPFATAGDEPDSVAFSPNGGLVAVADNNLVGTGVIQLDVNLEVFAVSPAGALSPVSGSPFATGPGALQVAFSPNGLLLATADFDRGQISVSAAAPSAAISSPAAGGRYQQQQDVTTTFDCQENPLGPGIASCVSATTGGLVNTSTLGSHTFTVTATSNDGLSSTATVTYTVVLPVPRNIRRPVIRGRARVRTRLQCTTGSWKPSDRLRYGYKWTRDGVPITGAVTRTYFVREHDRGKTLTCAVTASNSTGRSRPAASNRVHVPR
jgi:6-phosphogluconolactonase (cycloisomerase 2 family)